MDDPGEVKRRHWDDLASLHAEGVGYDVEGFLDGESTITWLEREGVGDVDGFWEIPGEDYPLTFSLRATKPV